MRNAGLKEAQAGIKIARKTINNLRYADNTTLMSESKKELKSLFVCVCVSLLFIFYLFIFFHLLLLVGVLLLYNIVVGFVIH